MPVGKSAAAEAERRVGGRNIAAWLAVCLAAMTVLTGWAVASPVGSSPDDDYHLASMWCAKGVNSDTCTADPADPEVRGVPTTGSGAMICYATVFANSAACQADVRAGSPLTTSKHGNWGGAYPPYFYRFMAFFTGSDPEVSVIGQRIINSLLIVTLTALLAGLLPLNRRPLATVPLLLTSVPLSVSILASNNPSSWAIAGAALVWPAVYVAFETTGRRQWALAAFSVLAAFIGSGSRADGCLFVAMSIVLVLIVRAREIRKQPIVAASALVGLIVATVIYLSAGHAGALGADFGQPRNPLDSMPLFLINLASLPTLWLGWSGSGSMGSIGWLDTPFPPLVGVLMISVWFLSLIQGWRQLFWGKALALVIAGLALVAHPLILLQTAHVLVGLLVQPRYVLPLIVVFTGLSLLGRVGVTLRLSPVAYYAAVAAMSTAHTIALHIQLRRYVTGLDVSGVIFRDNEWWWGMWIGPNAVWGVTSLAFAALTATLLRPCRVAPGQQL